MNVSPEVTAAIRDTRILIHDKLLRDKDFRLFERVYAEDATILPSGGPTIRGRDQILAYWRKAVKDLKLESVRLTPLRMEMLGDHVLEVGEGVITTAEDRVADIKYVIIWAEEDGYWKWYVDMWNVRD
jgi:ketosteroid isomerase-like protein